MGEGAVIKNLTVDANINITGTGAAGTAAVVGALHGGTIQNVTVKDGSVGGYKGVGGVVGRVYAAGKVIDCANSAVIRGYSIGGIAGQAYYSRTDKTMEIENCVNSGTVIGTYAAGGITSLTCGKVFKCENSGAISAETIAGGIVAETAMGGEIDSCKNTAVITGGIAGGIVGWIRYKNTLVEYETVSVTKVKGCENSGNIGCSGDNILGIGGYCRHGV